MGSIQYQHGKIETHDQKTVARNINRGLHHPVAHLLRPVLHALKPSFSPSIMMHMKLADPITLLPKTHKTTFRRLNNVGIFTVEDLLMYRPRRYADYSRTSPIGSIQTGETVTAQGVVMSAKTRYIRRNFTMQEVVIHDESGELKLIWFNQPYIVSSIAKVGNILAVAGTAEQQGKKLIMKPMEYEQMPSSEITYSENHLQPNNDLLGNQHVALGNMSKHTGKIVPIYSQRGGLSTRLIREKVQHVIHNLNENEIQEWLPPDIVSANKLTPYAKALRQSHAPSSLDDAASAQKRMAFDELFTVHLAHALVKNEWKKRQNSTVCAGSSEIEACMKLCIQNLPFTLTQSQLSVWNNIYMDMGKTHPMNRFLQGDVGSGKTVVAALAAYFAHLHGYRTLFMCPTQILANQHFKTISSLLKNTGVRVDLITGQSRKKVKVKVKDAQPAHIVVGTHALITSSHEFAGVGLIVIDEQHRFGVVQRAILKEKAINEASQSPHLLTMTATPIPRTVALTLFGDLDISVLTDMPMGRLPIRTYLAPANKRTSAYEWIRTQIKSTGCQVFVVCPRIQNDEADEDDETQESIKAVEAETTVLQKDIFPELAVGMLHGKMKSAEKEAVMQKFRDKVYDILVTTTVVEVGIDIPNATIMVIEGAERYGLAQLHQLRGRVGRGSAQSYCVLFTSDGRTESERLAFFAKTTSGMELAEYDFRRRGPGNIYGTAQHGTGEFDIANLFDFELVSRTQDAAKQFAPHYTPHKYSAVAKRLLAYTSLSIAKD